MKTLYLHVGYPKTGTTGIQRFMVANEEQLRRQGVLYPNTGRMADAHYFFNFALGVGAYHGPQEIPSREQLREQLRQEVQASGCDKIVISSEYFVTARNLQAVQELFDEYEVRIVIYLRRHDHALESGFAQSEKTVPNPPWGPDATSYAFYTLCADEVPNDYLYTLRRWKKIFGDDAILVRPYEKEQNLPDLFGDFLDVIGAEDGAALTRPGPLNSSLNRQTLAAVRLVRSLNIAPLLKEKIVTRLVIAGRGGGSDKFFNPRIRSAVVAKYLPSYRLIAAEFLGRENGNLFLEPLPRPNDPWTEPEPLRPEQTLQQILEAMVPLLKI